MAGWSTVKAALVRWRGSLEIRAASSCFFNGILVGNTAGRSMYFYARMQGNDAPHLLAITVFFTMIASCTVSGVAGSAIPIALRKAGNDPAIASSILLTTATDVVSMGRFLSLANWLVL